VTAEGDFGFLLVTGDRAQLLRVKGGVTEIRFLGVLTGGAYIETVRGVRADRERDMLFEHERLPGKRIEARERPPSPAWRKQFPEFAAASRRRTAALRKRFLAWSDGSPVAT
jgi:hypothetical protein